MSALNTIFHPGANEYELRLSDTERRGICQRYFDSCGVFKDVDRYDGGLVSLFADERLNRVMTWEKDYLAQNAIYG